MPDEVRQASTIERIARLLLRGYPLLSGCGRLATTGLSYALVPQSPQTVWATVAGRKCLVPLNDLVGRAAYLFGDLDPKVTWAVKRAVLPGDVTVDVGANLGVVLLHLARSVGASGKVIAFEPAPATLAFLEQTVAANPDIDLTLHRVAVGMQDAELTLRVPAGNAGRATLQDLAPQDVKAEHIVPVRRLADLLAPLRDGRIALMKMDIEGHESAALRGLFETPDPVFPDVILFEGNSDTTNDVHTQLTAQGYRLFGIPRRSYLRVRLAEQGTEGFHESHDFLAVRGTTRPEVLQRLGIG